MLNDLLDDDDETKKPKVSKAEPKKIKTMKTSNLDKNMILEVMKGGETIDDEINRPFWKFPQLPPYPYEHFIPAFLLFFGDKGASKTTCAMSVPGNVLAITFEKRGNVTRPWSKIFGNDPRIQPFGISEYIKRTNLPQYRDSSNIAYLKVVELLERAKKHNEKFDWVIMDGLQAGQKITTLRMKSLNSVGAFENLPKKLLTRWGERTIYLENIVIDMASAIANKGVVLTSQNIMHQAMFLTQEQKDSGMKDEDIPIKEPAWKDKIKEDVDTVIYNRIIEKKLSGDRSSFGWQANITTNKHGATGKYDITLQKNPNATKDLIKEILTSKMGFPTIEY